jgi:methionyl aminopeptidase
MQLKKDPGSGMPIFCLIKLFYLHSEVQTIDINNHGCFVVVEPILTRGNTKHVMWGDGWTALTADGSLTAQFEHTILITKSGAEILTKC